MITETTYQGYKNHATWCVNLWLHNEEPIYHHWRERARIHKHAAPHCQQVGSGIWTVEECARFNLAQNLKDDIEAAMPLQEASMWSDLLSGYLQDVDWNEIAESFLEE